MSAKEFMATAKQDLLNHALFTDAFIEKISTLKIFEVSNAKIFAELYYPHILRTRLYQANALGICPDENIQFVLADILHDEYGLGHIERSHMQQYRKFMQALDLQIKPASDYAIIPELQLYISSMEHLTRNGHWLEAVAAVGVASEWPIPKYYQLLLNGLRTIPGIKDSELELFIGHIDLDIEHSHMIEKALLPYLDNPDNQQYFMNGIDLNMNARRVLHRGLYREVFN